MKLHGHELISRTSKYCLDEWQDTWNCSETNKLHLIYHTFGFVSRSTNISRRDSVIISRLQIGHSCLKHSCLLSNNKRCATTRDLWATTISKTHFSGMFQCSKYPWNVLYGELS